MTCIDRDLIACPHCDTLHRKAALRRGEKMRCRCCGATLIGNHLDIRGAFFYALTALILFVIANISAFITLDMQGESSTISIFSSVSALFTNGLPILATIVLLCVLVVPLWYLLAVVWVSASFRFPALRGVARRFLHWMHAMTPWNMLEVYLLGVIVTLVKIIQMAQVTFDEGFWSFCALMVCSILVNAHFDLGDALSETCKDDG